MEYKRIVFMGTPYFARRILETLLENGYPVVAVVTQEDKPTGRKKVLTPSAVKEEALLHNIPILQPHKVRIEYEQILSYDPDLIITCAYGQFIPAAVLDHCLCLNVHASLLPKYRGGAPMQRSIMHGDTLTGVTIMHMAQGMDDGDMLNKAEVEITHEDTLDTLENKLIEAACPLLLDALHLLKEDKAVFTQQPHAEATVARIIKSEEEKLSFDEEYEDFYNHARALISVPCGYVYTENGQKLKICALRTSSVETEEEDGKILGLAEKGIAVALHGRLILLDAVQLEGKSRVSAREFMNGAGRKLLNTKLQ